MILPDISEVSLRFRLPIDELIDFEAFDRVRRSRKLTHTLPTKNMFLKWAQERGVAGRVRCLHPEVVVVVCRCWTGAAWIQVATRSFLAYPPSRPTSGAAVGWCRECIVGRRISSSTRERPDSQTEKTTHVNNVFFHDRGVIYFSCQHTTCKSYLLRKVDGLT